MSLLSFVLIHANPSLAEDDSDMADADADFLPIEPDATLDPEVEETRTTADPANEEDMPDVEEDALAHLGEPVVGDDHATTQGAASELGTSPVAGPHTFVEAHYALLTWCVKCFRGELHAWNAAYATNPPPPLPLVVPCEPVPGARCTSCKTKKASCEPVSTHP